MGHINPISLQKTLGLQSDIKLDKCEICIESKLTNQRNKEITLKPKIYLEKVVTNLCGPISPPTINGERYIIFFLDSATRHLEFKLLKLKSEAYEAFIEFKNRAENNTLKRKIQCLKSDQGKEFDNKRFKGACITYGIIQQYSAAYTHEQNGLIERINRTILEKVHCLLFTAKLPKYLWGEAVSTAVYLYNRTPHS
jgi:transposase InsO family protein